MARTGTVFRVWYFASTNGSISHFRGRRRRNHWRRMARGSHKSIAPTASGLVPQLRLRPSRDAGAVSGVWGRAGGVACGVVVEKTLQRDAGQAHMGWRLQSPPRSACFSRGRDAHATYAMTSMPSMMSRASTVAWSVSDPPKRVSRVLSAARRVSFPADASR